MAEGTIASIEWAMAHIECKWGKRKVATIVAGDHVEELFAELGRPSMTSG